MARTQTDREEDISAGKICLFVASFIFGLCIFLICLLDFEMGWIISIFLMLLTMFAYPVVGAIIISLCDDLRQWAYLYQAEEWRESDRLFAGAFWPLMLIYSLIVYTFMGIVHRSF